VNDRPFSRGGTDRWGLELIDFPAFNQLAECRCGRLLFNKNDRYIGKSLELYGEFSEGEVELFRQVIQPGAFVVEAGANIGTHTLFFARHVGRAGAVIAFEPQRIVFQCLCANMALNSVTNVQCRQQAVGSRAGEIQVPILEPSREQNYGGLSLEGGRPREVSGEPTPVVTIDSLNLARCGLIKVDVEGMERAVLEGAAKTIARCLPLLYVENDRRDKAAELVRTIDAFGYAMYWHVPPLFNPHNFRQNATNVFGDTVSINMLCVHKSVSHDLEGLRPVLLDTPSLI
jgi:FkbM family methyltransferase